MEASTTNGTTTSTEAKKSVRSATKSGSRTTEKRPSPISGLAIGLIILALLIGAGTGAFLMRLRSKAKEKESIVSVNGKSITKDRFYARLEQAGGSTVLTQMIGEMLREEYAIKSGVAPSEAEINKRFEELSKQPDFDQNLQQKGLNRDQFREQLRNGMIQSAVIGQGVKVEESEIKRFYTQNSDPKNPTALFYRPAIVNAAVIITQDKASAEKAVAELQNGATWQAVVQKYSKDRSKERNGMLPPIQKGRTRSTQVPGLEPTIFGMKIGDQVGPRQFAGAWWIIRCLDKQMEKTRPFEEVKEDCRQGVMLGKGMTANRKKIEDDFKEFQKKANIQAFWTQYRNVVNAP